MSQKYPIALDADNLIFIAEALAMMYVASRITKCKEPPGSSLSAFASLLPFLTGHNLQALLQEPLKDPCFRQTFNEHFDTHAHESVRMVGWPWLQEQLHSDS